MKRLFLLGLVGICWAIVATAAGSQHTVAVTLNYDFSVDNACSSSVTTGCVKPFNIYDITGGRRGLDYTKRQMKRCWEYQAIAGSRMAWVPCARMAEDGSRFCARHARAVEGAVLGALIHAEARDEAVTLYEDLRPWNLRGRKRRVRHRTVTVDERVAEVTACV